VSEVDVSDVQPGMTFLYRGTRVRVLRAPEGWVDRFGRDMLRFWATREDTGAEGWMPFGPGVSILVD